MTKITKREMYEALISLATGGGLTYGTDEGDVTVTADELKAFAQNEIDLLDKKAAKAKERAATKRNEGDALSEAVLAVLTGEYETIADIAARVTHPDATLSKVQYRLGVLFANGKADKTEISVPAAEGGKARKLVAYKLAD